MTLSRYNLKRLEVEGFRGINERLSLDFGSPVCLILGDNGTGKSSILAAIEWCLFGDVAFLSYLESSRAKKDELINIFRSKAACQVKVVLENADDIVVIGRGKRLGASKTDLTVKSDGEVHSGTAAEDILRQRIGLSFEDFYRGVYLHQESIRGLLTDEISDREEAMDRLFGLETLRNVAAAVSSRPVTKEIRRHSALREQIEAEIAGALRQVDADYQESLRNAQNRGLDPSALSSERLLSIMQDVLGALETLAARYELSPHGITLSDRAQAVGLVLRDVTTYLQEVRRTGFGGDGREDDPSSITGVRRLSGDLERIAGDVLGIEEEIARRIKENGNEEAIEETLRTVHDQGTANRETLRQLEEEKRRRKADRGRLSVHVRVAKDGLEYLREVEAESCPVCNQPIERDGVVAHLNEVLQQLETESLSSMDESIDRLVRDQAELRREDEELIKRDRTLRQSKIELGRRREALSSVLKSQTEVLVEVEQLLGKGLEANDALAALSSMMNDLDVGEKQVAEHARQREKMIQDVESDIEKARIVEEVMKRKQKFEEVDVLYEDEHSEIDRLEDAVEALEDLASDIGLIEENIAAVQRRLATEAVGESGDDIADFYSRLCDHPYFEFLQIAAKPRKSAGGVRNSYEIRVVNKADNVSTLASTRLSTGQMNCVALAVYLALSKVQSHQLDFLLLDDPSQSLDTAHKSALTELLRSVSDDRSVIVATQDEELARLLIDGLGPDQRKQVYRLNRWTSVGPSLSLE